MEDGQMLLDTILQSNSNYTLIFFYIIYLTKMISRLNLKIVLLTVENIYPVFYFEDQYVSLFFSHVS